MNRMTKERDVIVHVHIFKNAGSSFDSALLTNFKGRFVDHREDHLVKQDPEFLQHYLSNHPDIEAFSSHSIYHKPQDFELVKLHPVYFLRHPIERIRSVYRFEKKQPSEDSSGAMMAKKLGFREYIAWRMKDDAPATIRNIQTIFLAGSGPHPAEMMHKYNRAHNTVLTSPLIGIVDRYDESMVIFETYLRDYFPNIDLSYVRKNITDQNLDQPISEKVDSLLSEVGSDLASLIKKNNMFDIKLYDTARELLDEKISKIEHFDKKLEDFKMRCTLRHIIELNRAKNYSEAVTVSQRGIEKYPHNVSFYLKHAESLEKSGEIAEALVRYTHTLQQFPNNIYAYLLYGRCQAKIGRFEEANALLLAAERHFPDRQDLIDSFVENMVT